MADVQDIGPLNWQVSIVDKSGRPSPEFQRRWNANRANTALIGTITFGAGAPTGAPADGAEYIDTSMTPYNLYVGQGGTWHKAGVTVFTELGDVPNSYTAKANFVVRVNSGPTGLEMVSPATITGIGSALKWTTARTLSFTGDATGSGSVDGSANVATALTLANSGVTAGTYGNATNVAQVTVDAKGRITAATNVAITGGGGGGGMTKIAQVVAAGTPATITFSGISGSYTDLMLTWRGAGNNASTQTLRVNFNADTGANYASDRNNRFGSVNFTAGTYAEIGFMPGTGAGANRIASGEFKLPSYSSTTFHKGFQGVASGYDGGGTTEISQYLGGAWANTAAITQIDITLSAGNFVNGSTFTLYGLG